MVERLTTHLDKGIPQNALNSYLSIIHKWVPDEPVIYIDDSDIVQPAGHKFKALGTVRDGSKSTDTKNVYEKGYHVTEACVLTKNSHHKIFLKLDELGQDYVIRLTAKRKVFLHGRWVPTTQLRNRRKGKIKTSLVYRGKKHDAYLSHVKVQITASRKNIYLVLVYGITGHPMMLATNRGIRSEEDVIKTAGIYFSRCRIEEYFRCKKQMFRFENFRVRKLKAVNGLNFYIALCMAFIVHISIKLETSILKAAIIYVADPVKE